MQVEKPRLSLVSRLIVLSCLSTLIPCGTSPQTSNSSTKNPPESPTDQEFLNPKPVSSRPSVVSVRWPSKDIDSTVPAVAPDVSCPLSEVMLQAHRRALDLVANLEKFTATEVIDSSEVRQDGRVKQSVNQSFNYLAVVFQTRSGFPEIEESRKRIWNRSGPLPLTTTGLAASLFIFHPYYMNDFTIVCEGLGEWQGKAAWQLRFEQRPDQLPRFQSVHVEQGFFRPRLKGRAWITEHQFQIAHMVFDLLETIPEIQLLTEHSDINYGPVNFVNRKMQLWLPENVDFYIDIGGHRFLHRHRLSNFLLFSVDTAQEFGVVPQPKLNHSRTRP